MKRTAMPPRTRPMPRGKPIARTSGLRRTGVAAVRKVCASTVIPDNIKDAIDGRDQWEGYLQCQRCGRMIGSGELSRHHRDPRGMGGSKASPHTMANLVLLCGSATSRGGCHYEVESNRNQARIDGWLVPDGIRADEWPVRRFGWPGYQMPGETEWIPAEQHPLQAEWEVAA